MIAHLQAIQAALAPTGLAGFRFTADGVPALPYYVLACPAWGPQFQEPLAQVSAAVTFDMRVTGVAGTADGAVVVLSRVRSVLSPAGEGDWTDVPMTGRVVKVAYVRSEFVGVDPDVTVTGTNRHPGVAVDTYRIVSQPIPT